MKTSLKPKPYSLSNINPLSNYNQVSIIRSLVYIYNTQSNLKHLIFFQLPFSNLFNLNTDVLATLIVSTTILYFCAQIINKHRYTQSTVTTNTQVKIRSQPSYKPNAKPKDFFIYNLNVK